MKKFLAITVKILLTFLFLAIVVRQFQKHWAEISAYDWQIDPVWALSSFALGIFALYLHSSLWRPIIKCFGHEMSGFTAFRILYLSNLGRYIPGKVWQLFGVMYLSKKEGISLEEAGSSFVLLQMFSLPASALVFLIAAQFESRLLDDQIRLIGQKSVWLLGAGAFVLAGFITFLPRRAVGAVNWFLVRIKRPPIKLVIPVLTALKIFCGYVVAWAVYGLAFWLLTMSVADVMEPIAAIGGFILAHQIGYVALFAPGGLGPRELVLQLQLAPFFGPIAPAMVVVARIWSLILDGIIALIALFIKK